MCKKYYDFIIWVLNIKYNSYFAKIILRCRPNVSMKQANEIWILYVVRRVEAFLNNTIAWILDKNTTLS